MKNATITLQPASEKQPVTLRLAGSMTLANAEPIRRQLLELLRQPGRLVIQVDGVTALDVAFIQLLYALRHSARESGKPVDLTLNLTEEQQLLVARAGLNEFKQVI
ncbi:MAG: STAS domain-containing protein [Ferruginibacter sp.]|nr:STAS domain-containing protein [Cytophagales bacterium]